MVIYQRTIKFRPNWRMSLLACFCILFFVRLGVWQLHRAEEKKQMLVTYQAYEKQPAVVWQPNDKWPAQYQKITVKGQYLSRVFLLDNQHYQHKFGYHVLSPFYLGNDQILLIDRGWHAADMTRHVLPEIDVPQGEMKLQGRVYYPSEKNWLLGPLIEKQQHKSVVIELVDSKAISHLLHKSVYPFIMRLDKQEAHGYVRDWAIVAMPPERHYAYALQWFAFALIVLILFIILNLNKKHEAKS